MQRNYETMYVLRPQLEEEQTDNALKKLEDFITKQGGSVTRHEKKGKKRLAYEVKDQKDGHYVLLNFKLEPSGIKELQRFFHLSEDTIRHLVLTQEEAGPIQSRPVAPPPQPAAVAPVAAPVAAPAPAPAPESEEPAAPAEPVEA